jgi:hypothetical protein
MHIGVSWWRASSGALLLLGIALVLGANGFVRVLVGVVALPGTLVRC